jgi:hypothetical protein
VDVDNCLKIIVVYAFALLGCYAVLVGGCTDVLG